MSEFRPILRRADCGDGYSIAFVQEEGLSGSPPQITVKVDLNTGDETPNPRIILPDGRSIDVPQAFVDAYNDDRRTPLIEGSLSAGEKERMCGELRPRESASRNHSGWGWMVLPVGGLALSYVPDRLYFEDLSAIPGFRDDPLRRNVFLVRTAGDVLRTGTYTVFEPRISDTAAAVSDGTYGAFGLVMGGLLIAGKGGDPELYALMNTGADIGTARLYRHTGQLGGSLGQLGVGALTLILGFALPGGRPEVAERDIYVNLSPNPYKDPSFRARFPNFPTNLKVMGANHLALGLTHLVYYVVTRDPKPPPGPRFSFVPVEGGGMGVFTGTFGE